MRGKVGSQLTEQKDAEKKKENAAELDEKVEQKLEAYLAKEHGISSTLAHDACEAAKTLYDSLDKFSSNQYFSQATAKKWFELATKAQTLHFRAEEAKCRLAVLEAQAEIAIQRKEAPKLDAKRAEEVEKMFLDIATQVAECNARAQELLAELKEDFGKRA